MRIVKSVQESLDKEMRHIHKHRRWSLWRGVEALLHGGMLWLTALGRSRAGEAKHKHKIKAIDRLLGNSLLFIELRLIYAAVVRVLLKKIVRPVILVDITEIQPGTCALTASLANDGRGLPIYNIVRNKNEITKKRTQTRFLKGLGEVLPPGTVPILVTDAGFESPWFDLVEGMGWDYVGRVRHRTKFLVAKQWLSPQQLHKRAGTRAKNLGELSFPRRKPKARRIVLSKAPKSKGRHRLNSRGKRGKTANDRRCAKSAVEPWLLAASLSCSAQAVVAIYAMRMQIEQNFRDAKNHRWGWSLDQTRTRQQSRLEVLLLVATLATVIQTSVGRAAEMKKLHYDFQANTVRNRRVLSLFVLGRFLLQATESGRLTKSDVAAGFAELIQQIQVVV